MSVIEKEWFRTDRKGLAKLLERRGKTALLLELIANACDADGVTTVDVVLSPEDNARKVWVTVTDDSPEGFKDLSHAYTLFAESDRRKQANKRGRYTLGEKLVLAMCDEASIVTTKGGVMFDARGRQTMKAKRPAGSEFLGLVRMTRVEMNEIRTELRKIIPPIGVTITVNREKIAPRFPLAVFEATLPTELADDEGILRRTRRKTTVCVYAPLPGETAHLYELGFPVVETDDRWHVDIGQKIPLNMDRDNVTPVFLREIRTLVVNHMHEHLTEDDASTALVNEALADDDATPEAVRKALDLKFGEKSAIRDPNDLEANLNVQAQGYTLISGPQLTKAQWENVKRLPDDKRPRPAGQIAPTQKALFSPDGEDCWVPREKWTAAIRAVVEFTREVSQALLDRSIAVNVLSAADVPYVACFGANGFTFNLARLGHAFFKHCFIKQHDYSYEFYASPELCSLIIHELGHHFQSNHLDDRYHEALCSLGAKLAMLAVSRPGLFHNSEVKP
jgi:hypothetical protein